MDALGVDLSLARQFGSVLSVARKRCGISQQALAMDAGLDRTYISLLERGLRQPSLNSIFAIADALGVQPSKLIREVERIRKQSN